jgi:delta24-sterol reductase
MATDTPVEKCIKFLLYYLSPAIFALVAIYEKFFAATDDTGNNTNTGKWPSSDSVEESKSRHEEKVRRVQEQVKAWNAGGRKGHMCTKRPSWKSITVHSIDKRRFTQIEIDLEDIIEIDTEKKVLTVEPGMTMGRLTSILVPMGWSIPVVPELELLTIGGTICGAGLETSSHKYGLIADTVIAHEFVLASGEVINCSETENSDLHHCINMSHGTLGFLTAVQIPLIPASKHIKVEYHVANTVEGIEDLFQKGFREAEFIEGFMYAKDKAVIMLANFANE